MVSLLISFAVLMVGYIVYGKVTEKIFAPDNRQTPAVAINDGAAAAAVLWIVYFIALIRKNTPHLGNSLRHDTPSDSVRRNPFSKWVKI